MPPYTDSPLGAFLTTIGQGLPGLDVARRQRQVQDIQQQVMQQNLAQMPIDRARQTFELQAKLDPLAAVQNHALLEQAGIPMNGIPIGIANQIKQQQLQGTAIDRAQQQFGGAPPPGAAPAGAPAASGAPAPPGAAAPKATGISLTPTELTRFAMTGQFPATTAQEAGDLEQAKKMAGIAGEQQMGVLPEKDNEFVNHAMDYYSQLHDASRALGDPRVQHGGATQMKWESMKYRMGIGNSTPYDQLIPAMDMSRQQILSELANGIRNQTTRQQMGLHLPSSEDSPLASQQRVDNIIKYYPYMIYSRYASRGAKMPDNVARGLGFDNAAALENYAQRLDAAKPEIGQGAVAGAGPVAQGAPPAAQGPITSAVTPDVIARYAAKRNIPLAQAQAEATAWMAQQHGR